MLWSVAQTMVCLNFAAVRTDKAAAVAARQDCVEDQGEVGAARLVSITPLLAKPVDKKIVQSANVVQLRFVCVPGD